MWSACPKPTHICCQPSGQKSLAINPFSVVLRCIIHHKAAAFIMKAFASGLFQAHLARSETNDHKRENVRGAGNSCQGM